MTFHIITLFPEAFDSYINSSIIGRAIRDKKINVKFYNPRNFVKPTKTQNKKEKPYLRVDNKPYGGGPGMVLEAMPIIKAIEKILNNSKSLNRSIKIIWPSPAGKQFDNEIADKFKKYKDIIIICGRYEGIDARVKKIFKVEEVSVGPYVLTGGELPAMIIMDTVARRIKGVLGKIESIEENRSASPDVYTRPEVLEYSPKGRAGKTKKYKVPKILLTGHHQKIEEWRNKKQNMKKNS